MAIPNHHEPAANLHELLDALVDRSISDAQLAELNARLEAEPEARRFYMDAMRIEAELSAMHHAGASQQQPAGTLGHTNRPHIDNQPSRLRTLLAIACSVAIASLASSWATYEALRDRTAVVASDAPPSEQWGATGDAVARVAATRNCRWRGDRSDIGFGSDLAGGQLLELEAGIAELTFSGGARLVLEGPATFRIPDADTVELYTGRASAAVPRRAEGFSVRTPRLAVADSGAQFGLVASADGGSEVHVFEGPVHAQVLDATGRAIENVNLTNSEAVRLTGVSAQYALMRADGEGFVRTLATRSGPGEGLLAFDDFTYPVGPLAWQNGGFGWAGPWADLEAGDPAAGGAAESNGVAQGSLASFDLLALGNRMVQSDQQNRIRRALSTSIGGVFDAAGLVENADGLRLIGRNGRSIYVSFLQRVSKVDDVFYGFELHRGDGNSNRVLCVGNGVDRHGYGLTSNFQQTRGVRFEPLGEEDTGVNLYVLRIDFGDSDNDLVTVYRNPESLLDERSCVPGATMRGNFAFDRISLANFDGAKLHEIDEVRVGASFRAVTGQPAPANNEVAAAGIKGVIAGVLREKLAGSLRFN
ncbi:FecR protein [Pirellulimonas nuda]|uniref:FecR protein n=1 Tax=Pirellulimonas nuda TaxID=2528009 RepID=A0A518DFH4_9BACT|nr:FecR domain-containing protein [Pirellulimonas nuda]QDU90229.1 FecR protein [Pirellulimonas nuda]